MPIRPDQKARYPKNWKEISQRIRRRARKRCECRGECGTDHGQEMSNYCGEDYAENGKNQPNRCMARQYQPHHHTGSKVILTVAHLDHIPENCDDKNLKAMCQRCHNKYDAPMRRAGIKERRNAEKQIKEPMLF